MGVPRFYRPAWFLRLYVRLEDFHSPEDDDDPESEYNVFKTKVLKLDGEIAALEKKQSESQADIAFGGKDRSNLMAVTSDLDSMREERKRLTTTKMNESQTRGFAGAGTIDFCLVPSELKIDNKSPKIIDGLEATLQFKDAPLDSRIIRECLVEAYIGTISAESFGKPDTWTLPLNRAVLRFRGYVDTWEVIESADESSIQIKARSYEAVLEDGKINPRASAYRIGTKDGREKISDYVNRILKQFPATSGEHGDPFRAVWYWADPDKEPYIDRKTLTRSLQTAKSRNVAAGAGPGSEPPAIEATPENPTEDVGQSEGNAPGAEMRMPQKAQAPNGISIWSLIIQACELAGCIPMYNPSLPARDVKIDGATKTINPANYLLLTPAQTLYDDVDGGLHVRGGAIDGFSRVFMDENGRAYPSDVRLMVWGHNLKSIKFSRKLGKIRAPAVEVRSYNPDALPKDRVLSVRYPTSLRAMRQNAKDGKAKKSGKSSGGGKIDTVHTVVVSGIRDKELLKQIAVCTYHQMARGELAIEFETDDMSSFLNTDANVDSHNDDPDLLRLCHGSPVRMMIASKQVDPSFGSGIVVNTLSEVFDMRAAKVADLVRSQAGRFGQALDASRVERIASQIQTALSSAKLPDVFYCRGISHKFSVIDGYEAHGEVTNYFEVRGDARNLSSEDKAANNHRRLASKKKPTGKPATLSLDDLMERATRGMR